MINIWNNLIFIIISSGLLSGCFSGGSEDGAASGLFVNHKKAVNLFRILPISTKTLKENDNFDIVLNHDFDVSVTNNPRIQITMDSSTEFAEYVSGSGTKNIRFRYVIQAGDESTNEIIINDSIDLNTGNLEITSQGVVEQATLVFDAPNSSNTLVDTTAPTPTLISTPAAGTYIAGETLQFLLNFDEAVSVQGSPQIEVDIGGVTVLADYFSGSGTAALIFRYMVQATDVDNNGIQTNSPLLLNSGSITDIVGNLANLGYAPQPMPFVIVSGASSEISSVTISSDSTYSAGDIISLTLVFSDSIDVTGLPRIAVDVGGSTKYFNYNSGSGTDTLIFTYPVENGDLDSDGITLTTSVDLNGGTLLDSNTSSPLLNFTSPLTSGVLVDASASFVTLVTPANDGNYSLGQNLETTITFSSNVTVTGTPIININLDSGSVIASYISGSGTANLLFRYSNILFADSDFNGIQITSPIDLNSGTIIGANTLAVNLDFTTALSVIDTTSVLVNTDLPAVAITSSPDITSANETTYSVVGSCTENGEIVSVDIAGMIVTPPCISSAWTTGNLDVSALAEGAISITADHASTVPVNAIQAATTINKDTATSLVTISTAVEITQANETAYNLNGTCTDNGSIVDVNIGAINIRPNCASGVWSIDSLDISSLADGVINITVDHTTATQATTSVNKDTVSASVTITSAPNISVANELTYNISGSCSENTENVDLDIGGLTFTATCTSQAWAINSIDVSSLADGTVAITVDHNIATQVILDILKNTATPTVHSLSVASTLTNSADLAWSLTSPGAFTIDDYEINFRVKGTTTWLVFSDGVSTDAFTTVTGLNPSTIYEFRVRVQYDSSNFSDWSNTAEAETKPDLPIFSSPYIAMNVGGSTVTSVTAYYDNTRVYLNGVEVVGSPIGKGTVFPIPSVTAQFDYIDADKPIFVAGRRGSGGATAKANIVWQPTSWAGKSFSFNSTRNNPQQLHVFATENSTVQVKQGTTVLASATIAAGVGQVLSWSVYGSYQVTSTGTILAFHTSGNPATTLVDPKPLLPTSLEIIGIPSSSMLLTSDQDATNYNLTHSDSSVASGSLNRADDIPVTPQGTSTDYNSASLLIVADKKIAGASFADSNGSCASSFIPTNLMRKRYTINANADWVAFASKTAGTIDVYSAAQTIGVSTPIQTLTLTRSGANMNAPYKARLGTTTAGLRFVSTALMAAWYQPNNDIGASDEDETILYGTNE